MDAIFHHYELVAQNVKAKLILLFKLSRSQKFETYSFRKPLNLKKLRFMVKASSKFIAR